MLPFFPDPYPDELLYSVFSRYHLWSGNGNFKQTQDDLFGCRSAKPVFDLPSRIDALVERLPQGANYSSEEFIQNNTLYPYYAVFFPRERADQVISDMKSDHGGGIHMRTGIMAGGICNISGLRYCSICVRDDYQRYGEPYWHRTHQVPGVFVCPKHSFHLHNKCLDCGENLSDSCIQEYKALDTCCSKGHNLTKPSINRPTGLPKQLELSLTLLARDIDYLLKNNLNSFNPSKLRETYISLLQRMQLASVSGRIYLRELTEQFIFNLTPEFLSYVESYLKPHDDHSWLAAALRKPRKVIHPIRHLLIMRFLSGSLERFVTNVNYKHKPFGDGPWPCLNPVASHFKKDIVSYLKITRCTDTSLPVGTFICKCGFVYSRRGPDKIKEDRYSVGRIKSFGPIWEKVLQKLVVDGKLGLRGMAREMRADPGTIKKYINKLGLEADYLNIAEHTSPVNESVPNNKDSKPLTWMLMLENRRQTLLNVMGEVDILTRTQIRKRVPGIFTWLYRHDREWLNSILPPPINRGLRNKNLQSNCRINWEKRDEFLSKKVEKVVEEVLLQQDRPVRITLSKIGRQTGSLALLEKHLNRLPKTKALLKEVTESIEDFQVRRVHWAAQQISNEGEDLVEWRLLRNAGLLPGYSKKVSQAIHYELNSRLISISELQRGEHY